MLSLEIKVTPRASRDEIVGMRDGVLGVRVTAPPVDDAANKAVTKLIAKRAGVPRNRVRIARGGHWRHKRIEIEGAGPEELKLLRGRA